MKMYRHFALIIVLTLVTVMLAGCGKVTESWAYSHEPETEILSLWDNGKAVYNGVKYSYTKDDEYITLKDKKGTELKLKYVPEGDGILLYQESVYDYKGEGEPDGIIGLWTQDNGWSFEFSEDGKFGEENIFFGHYRVDESDSSIKLMYDDPLQDAILYYSVDGKKLTIDYPWPMVRTDKSKSGSTK